MQLVISGIDLLRRWGVRELELLNHVKERSLEPRCRVGVPYEDEVLAYLQGAEFPSNPELEELVRELIARKTKGAQVAEPASGDREGAIEKLEFRLKLLKLSTYLMEEVLCTEQTRGIDLADPSVGPTPQRELTRPTKPNLHEQAKIKEIAKNTWAIELGEEVAVCSLKGMSYISHLVNHPGESFSLLDLGRIVEGVIPVAGDLGEASDDQARREIRSRYQELLGDIEEARREGNAFFEKKYTEELNELITALQRTRSPQEIRGIWSRHGGTNQAQDPAVRREKKRIRKLLDDALRRLRQENQRIEGYLRRTIELQNGMLTYKPELSQPRPAARPRIAHSG